MKFKTQELVYLMGDDDTFCLYLIKVKYGLFGKYHYLRDEHKIPVVYTEQDLIELINQYPKAKFKNEKL